MNTTPPKNTMAETQNDAGMASPSSVRVVSPTGRQAVFSHSGPASFILGPCVLENADHAAMMARAVAALGDKLNVGVVYKTSFDKANRTSIDGYRGLGLDESAEVFRHVREEIGLPLLTDVHLPEQCAPIADIADILQIPAFLCRQTDLLRAAAETGRVVNVKKGQFLAPWDMRHVVDKLRAFGAADVMVTERGASFGYNTLVSDMRALPELQATGAPVIFDATHSVQQPGGQGATSGGQRDFAPVLARAAAAVGVAGLFMETHQDPDHAPSDGPNMIPLDRLEETMRMIQSFDGLRKSMAPPL